MDKNKVRVAHIVPAMAVGGVETAICRSLSTISKSFDYRIYYFRRRGPLEARQRNILRLPAAWITGSWRPQIVVTSLWQSHLFGAIARLFGASWVGFFHNAGFASRPEKLLLKWAWRKADDVFVDSKATGVFMKKAYARDFHVIPYRFSAQESTRNWLDREYDLIWVGRPVQQKRLDLVIAIVKELAKRSTSGRMCFLVAGDIPEDIADLKLGNNWTVDIRQSVSHGEVLRLLEMTRFFLLPSDFEGMCMSAIEAINAGCVPIIRRVGEIGSYVDADYELTINRTDPESLANLASRVFTHWNDDSFASQSLAKMQANLRKLPTYENSLLQGLDRVSQLAK